MPSVPLLLTAAVLDEAVDRRVGRHAARTFRAVAGAVPVGTERSAPGLGMSSRLAIGSACGPRHLLLLVAPASSM